MKGFLKVNPACEIPSDTPLQNPKLQCAPLTVFM